MNWFEDVGNRNYCVASDASAPSKRSHRESSHGFPSQETEGSETEAEDTLTPYMTHSKRRKTSSRGKWRSRDMSPAVVFQGNKAPPSDILEENLRSAPNVRRNEIDRFFQLITTDPIISKFLERDECMKCSDKYLIIIIFAYFKRCNLSLYEYDRTNFFLALYLAHDMEEDDENMKYEIFPWALGPYWREKLVGFLRKKDDLWARMNYRAVVSRKCCEELMALCPDHPLWSRVRPEHHAGAIRSYAREPNSHIPRGPDAPLKQCRLCSPGHLSSYSGDRNRSFHDSGLDCSGLGCFSDLIEESDATESTVDDILTLPRSCLCVSKLFADRAEYSGESRTACREE